MVNRHFEKLYQEQGFASQRRYPNEAFIQFLADNFFYLEKEKRSRIKILELGCGSGANLWMVAKEGLAAYGIDIAPTGIELCKAMLDSWGVTADLRIGDMKNLDFNDNYFDVIFDVVSMQHINTEEHNLAYKEVCRCLKPGGYFWQWHLGQASTSFLKGGGKPIDKFTVDNILNPNVPLHNAGVTCFLTPDDARVLLASVGFNQIDIETVTRTYKNMTQKIEYLAITAKK